MNNFQFKCPLCKRDNNAFIEGVLQEGVFMICDFCSAISSFSKTGNVAVVCNCEACVEAREGIVAGEESEPRKMPFTLSVPTVPELMADAAKTFKERNVLYGDSYKSFHTIAQALFPGGLNIETEDEWRRFGVLFFAIGKIVRYCNNFKDGGHVDSAHDLGVYSFMLEEVTRMGLKGEE